MFNSRHFCTPPFLKDILVEHYKSQHKTTCVVVVNVFLRGIKPMTITLVPIQINTT